MENERKKSKWYQVGAIKVSKAGKKYITLNAEYSKEGPKVDGLKNLVKSLTALIENPDPKATVNFQLEKPEEKLDRMLNGGYITQDQYEFRKSKIPEYVLYELSFPVEQ